MTGGVKGSLRLHADLLLIPIQRQTAKHGTNARIRLGSAPQNQALGLALLEDVLHFERVYHANVAAHQSTPALEKVLRLRLHPSIDGGRGGLSIRQHDEESFLK